MAGTQLTKHWVPCVMDEETHRVCGCWSCSGASQALPLTLALGARSPLLLGVGASHPDASCCLFLVFTLPDTPKHTFSIVSLPHARFSPVFSGPSCPVSLSVIHGNVGRS